MWKLGEGLRRLEDMIYIYRDIWKFMEIYIYIIIYILWHKVFQHASLS